MTVCFSTTKGKESLSWGGRSHRVSDWVPGYQTGSPDKESDTNTNIEKDRSLQSGLWDTIGLSLVVQDTFKRQRSSLSLLKQKTSTKQDLDHLYHH